MKKLIVFLFLLPLFSVAQTETATIYNVNADAKSEVGNAVKKATVEHKQVLLMIGGNWCRWCKMFDKFQHANASVDSALKTNYIFQHINFSKENKNASLLAELQFPQRFGFPVFVVLNEKGERIHTQNSSYLEDGEGYSASKVIEFLNQWSMKALDAGSYTD